MTQVYDPFDQMDKVSGIPDSSGVFFTPGSGIVRVQEVKKVPSVNPDTLGHIKFVVNFEVEEWTPDPGAPVIPPGAQRDWIDNLGLPAVKLLPGTLKKLNRIKHFMSEALQIPVEAVDGEISASVYGPAQTAKGARLRLRAEVIQVGKNKDQDYTIHTFSQIESEAA